MLEFVVSYKNIQKKRKIWGEELKKIGCSIDDRGRFLIEKSIHNDYALDEYVEKDNRSIRKEDIELVRNYLRRIACLFPLLFSLFVILLAAIVLLLYYYLEIDFLIVITILISAFMQILASFVWRLIYTRKLRYGNEELLEQEFAKRILERKMKS